MHKKVKILSAYDEYGEPISAYESQAASLAKDRDLGITRDRVLCFVAVEGEQVVGAGWGAFDGNTYGFDVAVSQNEEGRGIGRSLVQTMITERDVFYEPGEGFMQITVTSPKMLHILESEGFVVTDSPAKGFISMSLKAEVDEGKALNSDNVLLDGPSP